MVIDSPESKAAFGRGLVIAVSDERRVNLEDLVRSSLREMKGGASSGNWLLKNDELRSARGRARLAEWLGGVVGEVCDLCSRGGPPTPTNDLLRVPVALEPGLLLLLRGLAGVLELLA